MRPADTGAPPRHSWTADQLRTALLGTRHDLIFLAGHFSANNTLAADFSTTMNSTELAASNVNLENSIVFSAGCHSGYNIVNGDAVPGVTQTLDWVEAFAQKQATLIAGTGYQYGDTDFLAYSEQLYADFAHALRARQRARSRSASALVQAKQTYLDATPEPAGDRHQVAARGDALRAADAERQHAGGRDAAPTGQLDRRIDRPRSRTTPGATLGLSSDDLTLSPTLTTVTDAARGPRTADRGRADRHLPDRARRRRHEPRRADAAARDRRRRRRPATCCAGVGFLGGTYSDQTGITPLTGAPATELSGVHSTVRLERLLPLDGCGRSTTSTA